jgi:hypothetical protein
MNQTTKLKWEWQARMYLDWRRIPLPVGLRANLAPVWKHGRWLEFKDALLDRKRHPKAV